jgi:hypothetical protein
MSDEPNSIALVKDLAGAVSMQATLANRIWIAMMTVAFFAVVPRVPAQDGNLSLPFNLGEVGPTWFHSVVFAIFVVMVIAFAVAHAQQVIAQKLAQTTLDTLEAGFNSKRELRPREWFDLWRVPSLLRVSPLAQSLKGKHSRTVGGGPVWLRLVSVSYYALLKIVSLVVYFGMPACALWLAFNIVPASGVLREASRIAGVIAGVALLQVLVSDFVYSIEVLRYLWNPNKNP